jgi:hypothetical protein
MARIDPTAKSYDERDHPQILFTVGYNGGESLPLQSYKQKGDGHYE